MDLSPIAVVVDGEGFFNVGKEQVTGVVGLVGEVLGDPVG